MTPIVVFDTSVLLSAIGWRGKPNECLELARTGRIQAVTCREILEELADKLQRKLRFPPSEAAEIIADLLNDFDLISISGDLRAVPNDPKDDMIIECAVVAGAEYVVSGDRRHLLSLGNFRGIQIVSPHALLEIFQAG